MRVGYFTAGTVGAGHLARGLAIGRALRREGARAEYAMFAPRVPFDLGDALPAGLVREVPIDHEELRDPARAAQSELARSLRAYAPDVLLVDLFWAPLLHVLPLAGCEAWLLLRCAPKAWLAGHPSHAFDATRFARVFAIEPGAAPGIASESIEPIVLANPDEMRPARDLRDALRVADGEVLVVVSHAGAPGEWATLVPKDAPSVHAFTLGRRDAVAAEDRELARVVRHDGARFFPLAAWLAGADVVVSGAGYNAFWEATWLGFARRARFVALPRTIDDQAWRVRACAGHAMRANGADVLARRLR